MVASLRACAACCALVPTLWVSSAATFSGPILSSLSTTRRTSMSRSVSMPIDW